MIATKQTQFQLRWNGFHYVHFLSKNKTYKILTLTSISAVDGITRSHVREKPQNAPPLFTWRPLRLTDTAVRSRMKLHLGVTLVVNVAGFIHVTVGLSCTSGCAACWLNGDTTGLDTKFRCPESDCGSDCPSGYNGMHCARTSRCRYVNLSACFACAFSSRVRRPCVFLYI